MYNLAVCYHVTTKETGRFVVVTNLWTKKCKVSVWKERWKGPSRVPTLSLRT